MGAKRRKKFASETNPKNNHSTIALKGGQQNSEIPGQTESSKSDFDATKDPAYFTNTRKYRHPCFEFLQAFLINL
jgi:hypothetical protein